MLSPEQAAIVLGMLERGDKQHDIAAYFGVNSGRIIDVKFHKGKYAEVEAAPLNKLPPPGHRIAPHSLITAAMALADQLRIIEELITTTPPDSPSVVLDITPELAREILERYNKHNRNMRPAKIRRFCNDLSSGSWMVTGDTIKFADDLRDGQNRLRACLTSGVTMRTHVVFGINPDAFQVLDSGAGRTSGDTFQVAGVTHAAIAARAVRWLIILANPRIDRGVAIANADLFEHYQQRVNKGLLQDQIQLALKVRPTIPRGTLAALLYMFARKDEKLAKVFAAHLEKPERAARFLLDRIDHIRTQDGGRINERNIVNLTIFTWNAYRHDIPIKRRDHIRWTDNEQDLMIE